MKIKPQSSKKISLLITNDFPPIVSGISTVFYQIWKRLTSDRIIILAPKAPGVDTVFFHPEGKSRYLVEKHRLQNKQIIMTVGRLDERKGHDMVIRAMTQLTKRFPDVVYMIVGKGREEQRLKSLADNLKLHDRVVFTGFVADESLPDYYNLCDVFVLPNRETESNDQLKGDYEGFGVVFLEASACGKPAIADKSRGSSEAVVDGITGLMVDPRSDDDIAHAIERILEDKSFAGRLGMAGRNRAEKEFDWQHITQIMKNIL